MSRLSIDQDGVITAIYSDELAPLIDQGEAIITRASDVEPARRGPSSAELGGWVVEIRCEYVGHLPGECKPRSILGPFRLRSEALAAEVEYLESRLFGAGVESPESGVSGYGEGLKNAPTGAPVARIQRI
jgi:hypothetical protein